MVDDVQHLEGSKVESATATEMEVTYSGAAILSNRFYVSLLASGVRITFAEQYAPDKPPQFRTAVTMGFQDAISFYKLMQQQLKDTEISLEKFLEEQTAKTNG